MNRANEISAGFVPRALAFVYDYLIIALYLVVLVALGVFVNASAPNVARSLFGSPVSGQATGFLTLTLPVSLYFILFESSSRQATWGKRKKRTQGGRSKSRTVDHLKVHCSHPAQVRPLGAGAYLRLAIQLRSIGAIASDHRRVHPGMAAGRRECRQPAGQPETPDDLRQAGRDVRDLFEAGRP